MATDQIDKEDTDKSGPGPDDAANQSMYEDSDSIELGGHLAAYTGDLEAQVFYRSK